MQIDEAKARKALRSLYNHEKRKNSDAVQAVWLMIATKRKVDLTKTTPKSILLKHAIQTPGGDRCLLTRDPQQKYKDLLISKKIKGVHKVIGLGKFKKQYASSDKQKQLFGAYDMFLADKRIAHLLPKVLAKEFYKKHKEPMPVDLTAVDLQKEILRALRSTYMYFNYGDNCAIKIATTALNDTQAFENLLFGLPEIVKGVYGGAENIRTLQVKTADSTSLEIYNSKEANAKEQEDDDDDDDDDDDEY